jgi:hypothetical protein
VNLTYGSSGISSLTFVRETALLDGVHAHAPPSRPPPPSLSRHLIARPPGRYASGAWTCCRARAILSPYCTLAPRMSGEVSGGERVMRGKDWCRDYGNQDNGGFGTVVQVGDRCGLCNAHV